MRLFGIILCSVISFNISAQCSKDIECKGDRICVDGKCVFPENVKQEISKEKDDKPIELTQEQKKNIAGVVCLNFFIPFINAGHYSNDDYLVGGLFTAPIVPFTIALGNALKRNSEYDSEYHTTEDEDELEILRENLNSALYGLIITSVVTGVSHTTSTIIAGIRRSKIEKGILVRKKRVSLVPDYDLIKKQTSLYLKYDF